ncbi:MAG: hypothetical protein P8L27_05625 [Flavobacteriaceae bacterium]|jgi:hypothetical protein|nr:hypothetical protein [Flavobacteriaceae bacterium]MDG2290620.1 hypothetical protein [Flavobacteriaceae bacterium]
MAGFFYAVDFGKLNQLFLVRIELAEFTWTLSKVEVHIELAERTKTAVSKIIIYLNKSSIFR